MPLTFKLSPFFTLYVTYFSLTFLSSTLHRTLVITTFYNQTQSTQNMKLHAQSVYQVAIVSSHNERTHLNCTKTILTVTLFLTVTLEAWCSKLSVAEYRLSLILLKLTSQGLLSNFIKGWQPRPWSQHSASPSLPCC